MLQLQMFLRCRRRVFTDCGQVIKKKKHREFIHETTVDLFTSYFCDFTTSAKVLNLKPTITQEEQTCSGLNISGRREERKDDFTES